MELTSVIASFEFNLTTIYPIARGGIATGSGPEGAALASGNGPAAQSDGASGTTGVPLGQRP